MESKLRAVSETREAASGGLSGPASDALNLLRGVSAQLVLFGHAISLLVIFPRLEPPYIPFLQNIGVIVFFFISGVVISYTIDVRTSNFAQFVFDRSTRILTALIPALIFVACVDRFFVSQPEYAGYAPNEGLKTFIGNALFLADYPKVNLFESPFSIAPLNVARYGSLAPIWTVVLEFWIYVFFGFILLVGTIRSRLAWLFGVAIFIYSIAPVLSESAGFGLCFVWLAGAVYYHLRLKKEPIRNYQISMTFILALCLLFLGWYKAMMAVYGYDLRYSLVICIVLALSIEFFRIARITPTLAARTRRVGAFLASYSYSLYLVHYTILAPVAVWQSATEVPYGQRVVALVFLFLLCNVVAYLFYWLFESRYKTVRRLITGSPLAENKLQEALEFEGRHPL